MRKTILFIISISFPIFAVSQDRYVDEFLLKANWLEKFTRYIDWKSESDVNNVQKPFVIGIIGTNPFGTILDRYYVTQNRKIKNKRVEIKYFNNVKEVINCNMLFVAESAKSDIAEIVNLTKNKSILTVSDTEGFSKKGIHINFVLNEPSLFFEINERAVIQSGFTMDYELRQVAIKIINSVK